MYIKDILLVSVVRRAIRWPYVWNGLLNHGVDSLFYMYWVPFDGWYALELMVWLMDWYFDGLLDCYWDS